MVEMLTQGSSPVAFLSGRAGLGMSAMSELIGALRNEQRRTSIEKRWADRLERRLNANTSVALSPIKCKGRL